jgi:ABC-type amino acid transport system permease subunit
LVALGITVGVGLIAASFALEARIPALPSDIEGTEILFSPQTWGGLLIGGAALTVRAAAYGWSAGVVVGAVVASITTIPTRLRRLCAVTAPAAGACCAIAWLYTIG